MSYGKERILAVECLFRRYKELSTTEILRRLEQEYNIVADRKAIYDDVAILTRFMPIDVVGRGKTHKYVLIDLKEILS